MSEKSPIAILMPKTNDHERTLVRYGGLAKELGARGVDYFIAQSHDSYDSAAHTFRDPRDISRNPRNDLTGEASVVRDLTMALGDRPLYGDPDAPKVVHHPELNQFIARKDLLAQAAPEIHPVTHVVEHGDINEAVASLASLKAVVKPVTGHLSKGVVAGKKADIARQEFPSGRYLVHEVLVSKPEEGHAVIAIDTMRGLNAEGELVDVLCEVNRRPQRISRYDLRSTKNTDPQGIAWLASEWDKHEAEMLSKQR
jgi:hypothetical protein